MFKELFQYIAESIVISYAVMSPLMAFTDRKPYNTDRACDPSTLDKRPLKESSRLQVYQRDALCRMTSIHQTLNPSTGMGKHFITKY